MSTGILVLVEHLKGAMADITFEMLGVTDPKERDELIGRLYEATARHFRASPHRAHELRVHSLSKPPSAPRAVWPGIPESSPPA